MADISWTLLFGSSSIYWNYWIISLKISLWIVSSTVSPSEMTFISLPSISLAASLTLISISTQSFKVSLTIYSACLGMTFLKRLTWIVKSFIDAFWIPLCLISSIGYIPVFTLTKRPSISLEFKVQPLSRERDRPVKMPIIVRFSGFSLTNYSFSSMNIWSYDSSRSSLISGPYCLWRSPTRCHIAPLTEADGLLNLISSRSLLRSSSGLITFFTVWGGYPSTILISN